MRLIACLILALLTSVASAQTVARVGVDFVAPTTRESGAALAATEIARNEVECRNPVDTTQMVTASRDGAPPVALSVPYEWGETECRVRAVDTSETLGVWSLWVSSGPFPDDVPSAPSSVQPTVITITISVQGAN